MVNFIDKIIDFIFSKDTRKYVLLTFIIGFFLRILVALRNEFSADEMVYTPLSINFIASGKLQNFNQDALWFFLTDLFSKIFSWNILGVKFSVILFGSLSILLIYLIGKEIFNEKIALIANIIFTFSSFQLIQMKAMMDIPMSFFSLLALYFLILNLKTNKNKFFFLVWVSLGIAIMMKQIALLFIPAFVIFYLYYNKKNYNSYKIKPLITAAVIGILLISPILVHNYLLYKDKKILDMQFARFTRISLEPYKSIENTLQTFSLSSLFLPSENRQAGIIRGLNVFYTFEPLLVLILALLGLVFVFREKNKFVWLLILSFLFPFLFLAGTSLLSNHFVFGSFFISLLASFFIVKIEEKIPGKYKKIFLCSIIILIIIFSLIKYHQYSKGFFGKNELGKLIDFKNKNIEENSLVIVDSRIYRGRIVFMFHDRHYLESNYFPNLMQEMDSFQGETATLPIYYIEAVTDDSGWGTVASQPEFNKTSEDIADYFKQNSRLEETIYDIKGEKHFNVYKTNTLIKQSALNYVDSSHVWFFYPVGYGERGTNFDDYTTYNAFDSLLNKTARFVFYLEVLIVFLLSFYLIYLFFKDKTII